MDIALPIETPLVCSSQLGPYRRTDYDAVPEEEGLCELISGWIYKRPKLSVLHQVVLSGLSRHLDGIAESMDAVTFIGPLDVHLAEHTVLQPDVMLISAERRHIIQEWIFGAPDLVVEILTPGHHRRDRVHKLPLYARGGVREIWLVDPEERHIDFYVNDGGRLVVTAPKQPVYQSSVVPENRLDLAAFWGRVEAGVKMTTT